MKDKINFFLHGLFLQIIAGTPSGCLNDCPDSISFLQNPIKWDFPPPWWDFFPTCWDFPSD